MKDDKKILTKSYKFYCRKNKNNYFLKLDKFNKFIKKNKIGKKINLGIGNITLLKIEEMEKIVLDNLKKDSKFLI